MEWSIEVRSKIKHNETDIVFVCSTEVGHQTIKSKYLNISAGNEVRRNALCSPKNISQPARVYLYFQTLNRCRHIFNIHPNWSNIFDYQSGVSTSNMRPLACWWLIYVFIIIIIFFHQRISLSSPRPSRLRLSLVAFTSFVEFSSFGFWYASFRQFTASLDSFFLCIQFGSAIEIFQA